MHRLGGHMYDGRKRSRKIGGGRELARALQPETRFRSQEEEPMRKTLFTIAAVSLVAFFTTSTASAQCSFDAAGKAKGLKSDMTKAYAPCGSGITFPAANTTSNVGTPACTPPTSYSTFLFSAKGKCSVKTKAKLESPCSTPTPGDCSNLTVQGKCSGLTNPDTITGISGPGWALNTIARATFEDKAGGDMTVIDFPASFAMDLAAKGKVSVKSDTHALLFDLFGPGSELPGCTSLEVLSAKIVDPSGAVFANMGTSTR